MSFSKQEIIAETKSSSSIDSARLSIDGKASLPAYNVYDAFAYESKNSHAVCLPPAAVSLSSKSHTCS